MNLLGPEAQVPVQAQARVQVLVLVRVRILDQNIIRVSLTVTTKNSMHMGRERKVR